MSLYLKNPLKMDVIRDRGALARESSPGVIENVYRMQIMNTDEKPRSVPAVASKACPASASPTCRSPIDVGAAATRLLPLRLQVPADAAAPGPHKIEIVIEAVDDPKIARREKSTFILPKP